MTSTGSDGFRGVFEGSITGSHFEVTRRPYHKNCTCALHNKTRSSPSSSSSSSSSSCPHHKPSKVSYPIKRSWSEGSFSLYPAPATPNNNPSPSSSSSSSSSDLLSKGTHHHPPLIPRASSSSNFDFFISNQDI